MSTNDLPFNANLSRWRIMLRLAGPLDGSDAGEVHALAVRALDGWEREYNRAERSEEMRDEQRRDNQNQASEIEDLTSRIANLGKRLEQSQKQSAALLADNARLLAQGHAGA